MAEPLEERVPARLQAAIYGAGLFSFSQVMISSVVMALFVTELKTPAFVIGMVLGARHFLTMLLSIHGGVMMDRLGTRRVMVVSAVAAVASPLLYPFATWAPALIALQMLAGLADAMVWMGAQALSGVVMKGSPIFVGRMTFACRIGSFIGPLGAGVAWDLAGVWGGFGFMAFWAALGLACVLNIPADRPTADGGRPRVRAADLVPRVGDYLSAFSLAVIPAVTLVLCVTMIRIGGTGIQTSFYVVYLNHIGISGTGIGWVLGISGACASVGSLLVGPLTRRVHAHWLVVGGVTLTVITIGITPLLGGVFLMLTAVLGLRGLCLGFSQPLEISITGRAVDATQQGKAVGLRTTANRVTGALVPVAMGAVAGVVGIENSFLVMGAVMLVLMALVALFVVRHPALGRHG